MSASPTAPAGARVALVAGATGLVGRELLALLVASAGHGRVHVLARRPLPPAAAEVTVQVVDFSRLPELPPIDEAYVCLGSTIAQAGSQAAFRSVDCDAVVAVARAARVAGATRLAVVSALGADAGSGVFYNRVKGEMEAALAGLGFETLAILRPSLLAGDRASLGQPRRLGERLALALLRPVARLVPRAIRPVAAAAVAQAMVAALRQPQPGVQVIESSAMQP